MDKYKPTYTDISEWQINHYQNTGGTRSKKIALNPENDTEYFFKGSKQLPSGEIRYPTEFWSEIVSSKIGQFLGFDMLDYNIGYNSRDKKQKIGCLSQSMIDNNQNKLTEGKAYLTGFNPYYNPDTDKSDYTFQFIDRTLKYYRLDGYINNLIEVIIFDAVISNSDRHQENWGVITNFKQTIKKIDEEIKDSKRSIVEKILLRLHRLSIKSIAKSIERRSTLKIQSDMVMHNFAPIYDSGCCLGREKEHHIVEQMLKDNNQLESYTNKGVSEIHWEGFKKKKSHFELVKLLKQEYPQKTEEVLNRIKSKYNSENIKSIIYNIDNNLPSELLSSYKLSEERKELMFKIISLRVQKLIELL